MAGLLEKLTPFLPDLKQWDKCLLIAVGVECVPRDYVLQGDDLISDAACAGRVVNRLDCF